MFRLLRMLVLIALAFAAGVQFERADASEICEAEAEWVPYVQCAAREILAEVMS